MEKSIPLAAGMESRQETGSQSVSINSNPRAQDFHPTDAFRIVKHPSLWAAWVHVFAPSFITPFPGKEQGLWGPCACCTCFPFRVSANKRGGALTGHLTCITDISLDKWTLLPPGAPVPGWSASLTVACRTPSSWGRDGCRLYSVTWRQAAWPQINQGFTAQVGLSWAGESLHIWRSEHLDGHTHGWCSHQLGLGYGVIPFLPHPFIFFLQF